MNNWRRVLGTHEEPQTTATGAWPGEEFPGVALPSVNAKYRWVIIRYAGKFTCAQVRDIGPWTIDDDAYVFYDGRPRAELCKGKYCPRIITDVIIEDEKSPKCNGAGIDLFPGTAKALGIKIGDNVNVDWKFVEIGTD